MNFDPKTIAQILVLSVGAGVVFSFLRTTRGSGMIRGVVIAVLVVFVALLGLARWFRLAELEFIVEGVTGFAVVILAIVFQPELRRGIVSLGDNPLVRRVIRSGSGDAVEEVAAACVTMAKHNRGALIAFERDTALDPWTQSAQRIDARVNRFLLDSIFHTSSTLHDGAVIIREDRIAVAGAILPLSESDKLAQSVGTRHRAALGLSEETDAVVVAVSEETGLITVCQDGNMERRVLRDELADVLRARLGGTDDVDTRAGGVPARIGHRLRRVGQWLVQNPTQKLTALACGLALYVVAFRQVTASKTYVVKIRAVTDADDAQSFQPRQLTIVLPSDLHYVAKPSTLARFEVTASAPRKVLDELSRGLGGVIEVARSWVDREREVLASDILWGVDRHMPGLDVALKRDQIDLLVRRYSRARVDLASKESMQLLEDRIQAAPMPPNVELVPGTLELDPPIVTLRGREEDVRKVEADPSVLGFEPLDLSDETGDGFVRALELDSAASVDVVLDGPLFVRGRLQTRETVVDTLELDVAMLSFDGADADDRFFAPTDKVTVVVKSRGLLPDTIDREQRAQMAREILNFVREHARVFVDVSRVLDSDTTRVPVEVGDLNSLWPQYLGAAFEAQAQTGRATLWLEIDEPDGTVLLIPREEQ